MKKYFSLVTVSLLALAMVFTMPLKASAASTDQANGPFDPDKRSSLTVVYNAADTEFENIGIQLYRVADFTADYEFTLTEEFAQCGLDLNHLESSDQWATVADTLESYVAANSPATAGVVTVGTSNVTARFENLPAGWYFIPQAVLVCENEIRTFSSVMATLPTVKDGEWVYSVETKPKSEVSVPTYKDVNYFINVVWYDQGNEKYRPDSVVAHVTHTDKSEPNDGGVEKTSLHRSVRGTPKALMFRSLDVSTVILLLSAADEVPTVSEIPSDVTITPAMNWHYEWTAKDDGTEWNVIGSEVEHYTLTVRTVDHGWILEYRIKESTPVPRTGEESPLLPFVMLSVSGAVLVVFGIISRRKAHD